MLTFNQEHHEYRLAGVRVPSVTQITAPLMDFSGIPQETLERKKQIGTALHKAIELHLADDLEYSSIAEPVQPYFDAFLKFMAETGFQPRNSEQRVASKIYRYAGTLDLDGHLSGKLALIDYKTTHTLHPAVGVQTAAYKQAADETNGEKIATRYALHLKPDGTYRLEPCKDRMDFEVFKSLLNIHNWKETHHV